MRFINDKLEQYLNVLFLGPDKYEINKRQRIDELYNNLPVEIKTDNRRRKFVNYLTDYLKEYNIKYVFEHSGRVRFITIKKYEEAIPHDTSKRIKEDDNNKYGLRGVRDVSNWYVRTLLLDGLSDEERNLVRENISQEDIDEARDLIMLRRVTRFNLKNTKNMEIKDVKDHYISNKEDINDVILKVKKEKVSDYEELATVGDKSSKLSIAMKKYHAEHPGEMKRRMTKRKKDKKVEIEKVLSIKSQFTIKDNVNGDTFNMVSSNTLKEIKIYIDKINQLLLTC